MSDDFFSGLRFASSETREKPKKDTLKTKRSKLKTALEKQKADVKELIKDPNKEISGRDVRMFHKSGDHWRVQLRHGRRVMTLTDDKKQDDLIADDLNGVVTLLEGLIKMVVAKDHRIDAAFQRLEKTPVATSQPTRAAAKPVAKKSPT